MDQITEFFTGTEMSKDRPSIQPIEDVNPESYSEDVEAYFAHYDLDCEDDVQHWFGSFESGKYSLAAHLFKPACYKATVVLLHGYLNHTGQFKHLIGFLLEQGYAVSAFDLPGHGLSTGQSARIDEFEEYARSVDDFMKIVRPRIEGPYHALGFSTGGAILADLLLADRSENFQKAILAAPLIRWPGYHQSKSTYNVYIKFTDKIARKLRKNSSDKVYRLFNKTQDYLHAQHVSLFWVKALFEWNDKVKDLSACDKEILVLQGDKDTTVDWKQNLKLLGEKFPNAKIEMFGKARHELFNEARQHRQKVLESVNHYFQS